MPILSPMEITPLKLSLRCRNSLSTLSSSSIISSARRRRSIPSSVRVIFRLPRSNSFTPSSSSNSASWRDNVGFNRCFKLLNFFNFNFYIFKRDRNNQLISTDYIIRCFFIIQIKFEIKTRFVENYSNFGIF